MSYTEDTSPSPLLIRKTTSKRDRSLSSNTLPLHENDTKGSVCETSFDKRGAILNNNKPPAIIKNGIDLIEQPNFVQFHILGNDKGHNRVEGGHSQNDVRPMTVRAPDMNFENKYDMLEAYNHALDASPNPSALDAMNLANESPKFSNDITNIDLNRLRLVQIKQKEQRTPTPNKMKDLSAVLDFIQHKDHNQQTGEVDLQNGIFMRNLHKTHMQRVQSQQRSKQLNTTGQQFLQTRRTDHAQKAGQKNISVQMTKRLNQFSQPLELSSTVKARSTGRDFSERSKSLDQKSKESTYQHVLDLNQQAVNLDSVAAQMNKASLVLKNQTQRQSTFVRQRANARSAIQVEPQIEMKNRKVLGRQYQGQNHQVKLRQQQRKTAISLSKRSHQAAKDKDLSLLRIDNRRTSMLNTRSSLAIRDEQPRPEVQQKKPSLKSSKHILELESAIQLTNSTILTPEKPLQATMMMSQHSNTVQMARNRDQVSQMLYNSSNPREHQLQHLVAPLRQDFIVKTFTPSIETKVQRQARHLKGKNYTNRSSKIIEPHNRHKSPQIDDSVVTSPTRILVASINDDGIQRGGHDIDQAYSSQKKHTSSLFHSETGPTETIYGEFPREIPITNLQAYEEILNPNYEQLRVEFVRKDAIDSIILKESETRCNATELIDSNRISEGNEQQLKPPITQHGQKNHEEHVLLNVKQHRAQLEFRVINTKAIDIQQARQTSAPDLLGDFDLSVQNLELQPCDIKKRTMTANIRQNKPRSNQCKSFIQNDLALSSQATQKFMHQPGTQRQGGNMISHNSVRRHSAVQQRKMRKRLEATRKFNKEFNEPISIRRTQPLQQMNFVKESYQNSSFKDIIMTAAELKRPPHAIQAEVKRTKISNNKTHSLIVSSKSSFGISNVFNHGETQQDLSAMAQQPPSLPLSEIQDNNTVHEIYPPSPPKVSTEKLIGKKQNAKFGIDETGSIAKISLFCLTADTSKSTFKGKQQRIRMKPSHSVEQCKCPARHHLSQQRAATATETIAVIKNDIDMANPYNMTDSECVAIKAKNRSLIKRFQTGGDAHKSSIALLCSKQPQLEEHFVKNETVVAPFDQVGTFQSSQEEKSDHDNHQSNDQGQVNDANPETDLQDGLSPIPTRGVDSCKTETNEGNSPITRPVQYGYVNLKVPNDDDFETAQLSDSCRSNAGGEVIMGPLEFKERPASSKIGNVITVLKNTQSHTKRNPKKRVISQMGTHKPQVSTTRISANLNRFTILRDQEYEYSKIEQGQKTNSCGTVEIFQHEMKDESIQEGAYCTQEIISGADKVSSMMEGSPITKPEILEPSETLQDGQVLSDIPKTGSQEKFIQESSLPCYQVSRFNANQILSMNEAELDQLRLQEVSVCQQVLHGAINDLETQLNQAVKNRQGVLNNYSKQPNQNAQLERELQSIKRQIYKTSYEGNAKNRLPDNTADTPFSIEQQQMRKKYRVQSGITAQENGMNCNPIKFKLVDETLQVNKRQEEINNYFKYKHRKEKTKQSQESFQQRKTILEQCSPEEVLILGKIKMLMDTQQVLSQKAKMCSRNCEELLLMQKTDSKFIEMTPYIPSEEQHHVTGIRRLQINSVIDTKHMPVAQRVASRQSLHKLNKTGSTSDAQQLMVAAAERLNSINRQKQTRPSSNIRPRSMRKLNLILGMVSTSGEQKPRSGLSSSLSHIKIHSPREHVGDLNKDLGLSGHLNSIRQPMNASRTQCTIEAAEIQTAELNSGLIAGTLIAEPQQRQSVGSTINLYLKKVNSDHNSIVATEYNRRIPSKKVISSLITEEKQQQQQQQSQEDEIQNFGTQAALKNTEAQDATQSLLVSFAETQSPIDKFNLVYHRSSNTNNAKVLSKTFTYLAKPTTKSDSGKGRKLNLSSSQSSMNSGQKLHPRRQRSSKSGTLLCAD